LQDHLGLKLPPFELRRSWFGHFTTLPGLARRSCNTALQRAVALNPDDASAYFPAWAGGGGAHGGPLCRHLPSGGGPGEGRDAGASETWEPSLNSAPNPPVSRCENSCVGAYFGGSWTLMMRSAATFLRSWVIPEGHRISTKSAALLAPKPKWVGPALEEAYPAAKAT
jgi:hypothetical protein